MTKRCMPNVLKPPSVPPDEDIGTGKRSRNSKPMQEPEPIPEPDTAPERRD